MLVDDEAGIRKVLEISLSDSGYTVFSAENGEKALSIFKKERPPIVLTDIKMPGMDGIALLMKMKNEDPDTEVIMFTGHGDMDLAIESLKQGATDFLTKPINDDVLEIALKRAREKILIRQKLREYTQSLEALLREKTELQDRLSSLGLMLSSIAHGIKGLLTGMDGGIYMVDSGLKKKDLEKTGEGWQVVKLLTERVRKMVMDILFYARERDLMPEWVSIRNLSEEVAMVVEPKMKTGRIEFIKDFQNAPGTFEVDAGFIRSALINILENAVDAFSDREEVAAQVVFRARELGDIVQFDVIDNGIGMDSQIRDKIFTLFFSSKANRGTGLGLFIANKIVCQHGGSIRVDSRPGQGSRFSIKIPKKLPFSKITPDIVEPF